MRARGVRVCCAAPPKAWNRGPRAPPAQSCTTGGQIERGKLSCFDPFLKVNHDLTRFVKISGSDSFTSARVQAVGLKILTPWTISVWYTHNFKQVCCSLYNPPAKVPGSKCEHTLCFKLGKKMIGCATLPSGTLTIGCYTYRHRHWWYKKGQIPKNLQDRIRSWSSFEKGSKHKN